MILQCLHIFTLINIFSEGTSLVQECTKYFIGLFLCLPQGTVPLLKMYQAYFYINAIFHMQLLSVCLIECTAIGFLCHKLRCANLFFFFHRKFCTVEMMNYPMSRLHFRHVLSFPTEKGYLHYILQMDFKANLHKTSDGLE